MYHSLYILYNYLTLCLIEQAWFEAPSEALSRLAMYLSCIHLLLAAIFIIWTIPGYGATIILSNISNLTYIRTSDFEADLRWRKRNSSGVLHSRQRRYISSKDITGLLDYHNRVRSQVFPPAANMEFMVIWIFLVNSSDVLHNECCNSHYILQLIWHLTNTS